MCNPPRNERTKKVKVKYRKRHLWIISLNLKMSGQLLDLGSMYRLTASHLSATALYPVSIMVNGTKDGQPDNMLLLFNRCQMSRASRMPENCQQVLAGKKLRKLGRMRFAGVMQDPPRSTY